MLRIVILGKQYDTKKQALVELAFCHYPVRIEVNGKEYVFEWFSDVEKFFATIED